MEPMQIITIILVAALAILVIGLGANRIRKTSESAAETMDKLLEEYIDTIIQLAKDIIVISQVKRENCDTQEDYEQILMRMVARRLCEVIYNDIQVDARFKEIINEETLVEPLIFLYRQYEARILEKVDEESAFIVLPNTEEIEEA